MACRFYWNGIDKQSAFNGQQSAWLRFAIPDYRFLSEVSMFHGKKVIVIGERDGIASPALAICVQATGGEVILSATECFV